MVNDAGTMKIRDAVLVVPGIMGSELIDDESGAMLWGLRDPRWYVSTWTTGRGLRRLALTDDELSGRTGRVRPGKLLSAPAYAPVLRGAEPYTALVRKLQAACVHPCAVAEFPYDWRLPVRHTAQLLADAAERHLRSWRKFGEGHSDAKLIIVAHSMGGLLARHFVEDLGGAAEVRKLTTFGTPYFGAVKAAVILNLGRGAPVPLPRKHLRTLAATLPGVYDLLPRYRCVDEDGGPRLFTEADTVAIGGNADLAALSLGHRWSDTPPPQLRTVVGLNQPTAQSMTIEAGKVNPKNFLRKADGGCEDHSGDGTVFRLSATGFADRPGYLSQQHAALAKAPESLDLAHAILTEQALGPALGAQGIGVDAPDLVAVGQSFTVRVVGSGDAAGLGCRILSAESHEQVARPVFRRQGAEITARALISTPGVYRIDVKQTGASPVSCLLMAAPGDELSLWEE
ncbi:esterase/lipase family protein [Streptomyces sp. NPDC058751]|uniref:esterase/lipase family protein n=1 Tax=Streptomyces sp. NPDC058751 TaxID=3346623 RepID=UPI0036A9BFCC